MADRPAAERTEKPTPERLRKAREEGQLPQSKEVPSAVMLTMLLVVLGIVASTLGRWFASLAERGLALHRTAEMDVDGFTHVLRSLGGESLVRILPFLLAAAAASAFASFLVGGWVFSPKALRIDLSRLSPSRGLRSLLSSHSLANLVVSLAKLIVILALIWQFVHEKMEEFLALQHASPAETLAGIARLVLALIVRLTIGLVAIAAADLLYQRWHHSRQLRMTRQEVKEETRQHEMSPELRSRIRGIQLRLARTRIAHAVPTADVVITNPTHVAVALKYDAAAMEAPKVVAKGADLLASRIRQLAREHDVPVVERPHLARVLYATVEVDQTIPETLYVAVAEVLAMIYRLRKGRTRGAR